MRLSTKKENGQEKENKNSTYDSVTSVVHCNMHALEVSRTFKIFIIIKFLEHSRVTKL